MIKRMVAKKVLPDFGRIDVSGFQYAAKLRYDLARRDLYRVVSNLKANEILHRESGGHIMVLYA